jgi:hypothetical protein
MQLRYEQRRTWKVDDMRGVDIWKVVGLSGVVPGDGTEVWGVYI